MKGVYVLLIFIAEDIDVSVGALGDLNLQKGLYAYVGSAQNNLEKRVERHLRRTKTAKFWHIDYLLSNRQAEVVKAFYKETGKFEECRIARSLSEKMAPVKGFGSSDCRCIGHLFRIEAHDHLGEFMREIGLTPLGPVVQMVKTSWGV